MLSRFVFISVGGKAQVFDRLVSISFDPRPPGGGGRVAVIARPPPPDAEVGQSFPEGRHFLVIPRKETSPRPPPLRFDPVQIPGVFFFKYLKRRKM